MNIDELRSVIAEMLRQGDLEQSRGSAPLASVLALVYIGDALRELAASVAPKQEEQKP